VGNLQRLLDRRILPDHEGDPRERELSDFSKTLFVNVYALNQV